MENTTNKILVVEDDEHTRNIVCRAIEEKYKTEVITAKDGMEALDLILKKSPDLVLLDISMPNMDGIKLMEILRLRYELIRPPIVAMTASTDPYTIQRMINLGVEDYITKPFNFEKMYRIIDKVLMWK